MLQICFNFLLCIYIHSLKKFNQKLKKKNEQYTYKLTKYKEKGEASIKNVKRMKK